MAQSAKSQSFSNPVVLQELTLELTLEILQEALRMQTLVLEEKIISAFDESFKDVFETKEVTQIRSNETRQDIVLVSQGLAEYTGLLEESEEEIYQPSGNLQNIVGKALTKMSYHENLREIFEESFAQLSANLKNEFDWQTENIYSVNLLGQKQLPRDIGIHVIKKKIQKGILQVFYKNKSQKARDYAFVVKESRNCQILDRGEASDGKAGCLLLPEVNRRKEKEMARNGIG